MPAAQLSDEKKSLIREHAAAGASKSDTARRLGLNRGTVARHWPAAGDVVSPPAATPRLPDPAPEAGGPDLPAPAPVVHDPYRVDGPGRWLVLGDLHIPYHDPATIRAAVTEARKAGVAGVLLNGDVLDFYGVSKYSKDPSAPRVRDEIDKGRQFLAWLRSQFPDSRIVLKEGNHDERLKLFVAGHCAELFDIDDLQLPSLLRAEQFGVEWVADKRAVHLGKLPVFHGHEFTRGQGINPARWLFLQIVSTGACGHFHRTSEHHEASYDGRLHGVWSIGCACHLRPMYAPNNKWNHGWGFVEIAPGGGFEMRNRRMLRDGRVC